MFRMNENWIQVWFETFWLNSQRKLCDSRRPPSFDSHGLIKKVVFYPRMFEGFVNFPKASRNCWHSDHRFLKSLQSYHPLCSSPVTCSCLNVRWDSSPMALSLTSWNARLCEEPSLDFAILLSHVCTMVWMFKTAPSRDILKGKGWAKPAWVSTAVKEWLFLSHSLQENTPLFPPATGTCGAQIRTRR